MAALKAAATVHGRRGGVAPPARPSRRDDPPIARQKPSPSGEGGAKRRKRSFLRRDRLACVASNARRYGTRSQEWRCAARQKPSPMGKVARSAGRGPCGVEHRSPQVMPCRAMSSTDRGVANNARRYGTRSQEWRCAARQKPSPSGEGGAKRRKRSSLHASVAPYPRRSVPPSLHAPVAPCLRRSFPRLSLSPPPPTHKSKNIRR